MGTGGSGGDRQVSRKPPGEAKAGTGGSSVLVGFSVDELLQGAGVQVKVHGEHTAAVHAHHAAVGVLLGNGHLFGGGAAQTGSHQQQLGQVRLGQVGLHHGEDLVQQVVQLQHAHIRHAVPGGLDHPALALNAGPVGVNLAQAGVGQRLLSVEVVGPHPEIPVAAVPEIGHLRLDQLDVHAAHGLNALDEGAKVHPHIFVHLDLEALPDFPHHQVGAAVAEGVGQPVILSLILSGQDRHPHTALKADQLYGAVLLVDGQQHTAVAAGIGAESVGGALVGADEQNVDHILVAHDLAVRQNGVLFLQPGGALGHGVGFRHGLAVAGVDGVAGRDAVAVVEQAHLAVIEKVRRPDQKQQNQQDDEHNPDRRAQLVLFFAGF